MRQLWMRTYHEVGGDDFEDESNIDDDDQGWK